MGADFIQYSIGQHFNAFVTGFSCKKADVRGDKTIFKTEPGCNLFTFFKGERTAHSMSYKIHTVANFSLFK